MLHIAIIGCGQIGSRHLQALANLGESAAIYLVDPSPDAISRSKERFRQRLDMVASPPPFVIKEIDVHSLPKDLDLAIVACSSDARASALKILMLETAVPYVIAEKFLFQKEADYREVLQIKATKHTAIWVNEWMTGAYAFQRLAGLFKRDPRVSMEVSGINWGLCCNSVHFINYFDKLNKYPDMKLKEMSLDHGMIRSKRHGFFELTGAITFVAENGAELKMVAKQGDSDPNIEIAIAGAESQIRLLMGQDSAKVRFDGNDHGNFESFKIAYQSEMTYRYVEDIMLTGRCELPTIERASYHHLLVLPQFLRHMQTTGGWENENCPIT